MRAIEYNKEEHLAMLQSWCKGHNKPPFPDYWLPDTGIVVYNSTNAIIAAFLYLTNSGLAFVECVISNPASSKEERQSGLDCLDNALMQLAKRYNVKALQGQTAIQSVADASNRNNWISTQFKYSILVKIVGE